MTYKDFIIAAQQKFPCKFEYLEETFVDDNTPMKIKFYGVEFELKPKIHLKSETGFPHFISYDMFIEIAKVNLKEEFNDYEFNRDNYVGFSKKMEYKYKGVTYEFAPINIVKSYRKSDEYYQIKEIVSRYEKIKDLNYDYPGLYAKIYQRNWFELAAHIKKYRSVKDWKIYKNREWAASQCIGSTDYREKFRGAWDISYETPGELDYFKEKYFIKQETKWETLESREKAASTCRNLSEYCGKYPAAYKTSLSIDGELDMFFEKYFSKTPKRKKNTWNNFEERDFAASQCLTRNDYHSQFRKAYDISKSIPGEMELFD